MSVYPEQKKRSEKETVEDLYSKMLDYANALLNNTETGLRPERQDRLIEVFKAIEMHRQTEAINHMVEQLEALRGTTEKGFYVHQS